MSVQCHQSKQRIQNTRIHFLLNFIILNASYQLNVSHLRIYPSLPALQKQIWHFKYIFPLPVGSKLCQQLCRREGFSSWLQHSLGSLMHCTCILGLSSTALTVVWVASWLLQCPALRAHTASPASASYSSCKLVCRPIFAMYSIQQYSAASSFSQNPLRKFHGRMFP